MPCSAIANGIISVGMLYVPIAFEILSLTSTWNSYDSIAEYGPFITSDAFSVTVPSASVVALFLTVHSGAPFCLDQMVYVKVFLCCPETTIGDTEPLADTLPYVPFDTNPPLEFVLGTNSEVSAGGEYAITLIV